MHPLTTVLCALVLCMPLAEGGVSPTTVRRTAEWAGLHRPFEGVVRRLESEMQSGLDALNRVVAGSSAQVSGTRPPARSRVLASQPVPHRRLEAAPGADVPIGSSECSDVGFPANVTEVAYYCNGTQVTEAFYNSVLTAQGAPPAPQVNPAAALDIANGVGGGLGPALAGLVNASADAIEAALEAASGLNETLLTLQCTTEDVPTQLCICPLDYTGETCEARRRSSCALELDADAMGEEGRAMAQCLQSNGASSAAAARLKYDTRLDGDPPCLLVDVSDPTLPSHPLAVPVRVRCGFEDGSPPLLCNGTALTEARLLAVVDDGVDRTRANASSCPPGQFFNASRPGASDSGASLSARLAAGCQLCPAGHHKPTYGNENSCAPCPAVGAGAWTTGASAADRARCVCNATARTWMADAQRCEDLGLYRGATCLEEVFVPHYHALRRSDEGAPGVSFASVANESLAVRTDPINFKRLYDDSGHMLSAELSFDQYSGLAPVVVSLNLAALFPTYFQGGRLFVEMRLSAPPHDWAPALPAHLTSAGLWRLFVDDASYTEPKPSEMAAGAVAGIVLASVVGGGALLAGLYYFLVWVPRKQDREWRRARLQAAAAAADEWQDGSLGEDEEKEDAEFKSAEVIKGRRWGHEAKQDPGAQSGGRGPGGAHRRKIRPEAVVQS